LEGKCVHETTAHRIDNVLAIGMLRAPMRDGVAHTGPV